jgi:hypothetical protein
MSKNMSIKFAVIAFLIVFGLFSLTILAQDKKEELSSKLELLKGKVEKITAKVDGKDVVFEGKDAEKLAKHLKMFADAPMVWTMTDDCDEKAGAKKKIMMFGNKGMNHVSVLKTDGDNKKVKVEVEDGKKKISVTTVKDGKEETKVYEGQEAEKFLEENKKEGKFDIIIDRAEDDEGDLFFFKHFEDEDGCCKGGCRKGSRMMMKHFPTKEAKKIIIEKIEKEDKAEKKENKK